MHDSLLEESKLLAKLLSSECPQLVLNFSYTFLSIYRFSQFAAFNLSFSFPEAYHARFSSEDCIMTTIYLNNMPTSGAFKHHTYRVSVFFAPLFSLFG